MDYMVVQDNIARLKLVEVIPETICAYSQVNDIDDIKIFDGDIIETVAQQDTPFRKQTTLFVQFVNGSFWDTGDFVLEAYEFRFCRVIGNFYDTPELNTENLHMLPAVSEDLFDIFKDSLNVEVKI